MQFKELTGNDAKILFKSLKEIFKRQRPFHLEGVESEEHWITEGYSFPSGHSQAAGVLGYTAYDASKETKKNWLWYIGIAIMTPILDKSLL